MYIGKISNESGNKKLNLDCMEKYYRILQKEQKFKVYCYSV